MKHILSLFAIAALALGVVARADDAPKTKGEKPLVISHGESVKIADYAVTGKTTVFDFTSKFCPPCQKISPMLDKLHADKADIAVVKVDINRADVKGIDWKSPVAQQYKLQSIPHFIIYNDKGEKIAEGDKARDMVFEWLEIGS